MESDDLIYTFSLSLLSFFSVVYLVTYVKDPRITCVYLTGPREGHIRSYDTELQLLVLQTKTCPVLILKILNKVFFTFYGLEAMAAGVTSVCSGQLGTVHSTSHTTITVVAAIISFSAISAVRLKETHLFNPCLL